MISSIQNPKTMQFMQSLDPTRSVTLVTPPGLAKREAQLVYKYDDNGELVSVPNIWYNQTREMRIEHLEWRTAQEQKQLERRRNELTSLGQGSDVWSLARQRELRKTIAVLEDLVMKSECVLEDMKAGKVLC